MEDRKIEGSRIRDEFEVLVETVARLRAPGGCPWDREQTHVSLKKYAIEETYEVLEAIDSGDPVQIEDELGDMLLQVLLHAEIAREQDQFDIADVCATIRKKLQRRHPHVFADVHVNGVDDVLSNWDQIKGSEPGYEDRKSVLDGVPESLPALMRAAKLSRKAARTGFDWPDVAAVFDKLREESIELEQAIESADKDRIRCEIGDMLFTIVNIARHEDIDPEEALREMLGRFSFRFGRIEQHAEKSGKNISEMTLAEMDEVWEAAKGEQ